LVLLLLLLWLLWLLLLLLEILALLQHSTSYNAEQETPGHIKVRCMCVPMTPIATTQAH
jgi:hypothetical protein